MPLEDGPEDAGGPLEAGGVPSPRADRAWGRVLCYCVTEMVK